jgi:RNA polymerase sigma factor (sigma-70 family)
MEVLSSGSSRERELLSRVILRALESWPERDRQIFVEIHYEGHTIESISREIGISAQEADSILERCEQDLYGALRRFRSG